MKPSSKPAIADATESSQNAHGVHPKWPSERLGEGCRRKQILGHNTTISLCCSPVRFYWAQGAVQIGGELSCTSMNDKAGANSQPRAGQAPPPLTTAVLCGRAFGPPLCGGTPPATPPPTPCHVGAASPGVLSIPPVAHPPRAAKPSAVTTVGAGLVPAHSHPKTGLHPGHKARLVRVPNSCPPGAATGDQATVAGPEQRGPDHMMYTGSQTVGTNLL